ncbi:MAG: hypothetical protein NUV34_05360, partial [Sulfuricaulis sp.]|nr:hypothetical protein [Sulfuricaulis sp.]
ETINLDKSLLKNLPNNERWLSRMRDDSAPDPATKPMKNAMQESRTVHQATGNGPAVELF